MTKHRCNGDRLYRCTRHPKWVVIRSPYGRWFVYAPSSVTYDRFFRSYGEAIDYATARAKGEL